MHTCRKSPSLNWSYNNTTRWKANKVAWATVSSETIRMLPLCRDCLKWWKYDLCPQLCLLKDTFSSGTKERIRIISFEPISDSLTSNSIHELSINPVWIDVIGTIWREKKGEKCKALFASTSITTITLIFTFGCKSFLFEESLVLSERQMVSMKTALIASTKFTKYIL